MTKEKDVIENLRYNIIRRYWVEKYTWTAEELAAYAATFVFPFIGNISPIKEDIKNETNELSKKYLQNIGTISKFIDLIEKISKQKNKVDLPKLREDALMSYFYQKFANHSLDVAKLFVKDLTFIQVGEDGKVYFKENETYMTNISNGNLSTLIEPSYGNEKLDYENVSDDSIKTENILKQKSEGKNRQEMIDQNDIVNLWENADLDYESLKKPYFWENKLSKTQYNKLKDSLKRFFNDKENNLQQNYLNIDKCSLLVALFVAEWFKWEYSGNEDKTDKDSKQQPKPKVFEEISLKANFAQKICKTIRLDVYQTDNNTNRWLDSLYALGGFPLSKSEDYEKVFKTIYDLRKDDEEETSNEGLKKIADAIGNNNQTFRQSAEEKDGSFHKYIEYIWENNDIPVSDADKASDEYKCIKKLLDEGRIEAEENKFKLEWEALSYNGHWKLSLLLTFIKDITIQRDIAKKWGASDEKLNLVVKNGNEDLRRLTFYRTKEGDYACYKNFKKYVLASDEGEWDFGVLHGQKRIDFEEPITIYCNNEKILTLTLDKEWKFRDAGMFRWTTAGKKGNLAVFLPFKNKVDNNGDLESPLEEFRISDSTSLWIPIDNKLEGCQYNNKSIGTLYPYESGKIYIEPESLIHPGVIHYQDEKFVNCLNDDEMQKVFLIHSVDDLKCILYDDKNKKEKYKEITPDKNLAFYNEGDEEKQTGYCRVTATYNNKTTTADCYIVGEDFNPKRKEFGEDVDFTEAYVNIQDSIYTDLYYDVYVGETGIYNVYTKRMLNKKGGVLRHLDCYYYRNEKGTLSPLYQENKYKALKKIFNDIKAVAHDSGNQEIVLTIEIDGKTFTFQPFSNKAICVTNDYKYRVPLNKEDNGLEGCKFCYCTFDDILKVNEVSIKTRQTPGYVYLDFTRSDTYDGILFQSLKDIPGDDSTSEYYFRPMFIPKIGGEKKIRDKEKPEYRQINIERERRRFQDDYQRAINAFLLATEHKLYYTSMDSLCALVHNKPNPVLLIEFYLAYITHCKETEQEPNYKALYNLAEELLFDWWFIPQYMWNYYKEKHQEAIESLLREKPVSTEEEKNAKQRIVDSFWGDFGNSKGTRGLEMGEETLKVANSLRSTSPRQKSNFFNQIEWKNEWVKRTISNFSFLSLEKLLKKKKNTTIWNKN